MVDLFAEGHAQAGHHIFILEASDNVHLVTIVRIAAPDLVCRIDIPLICKTMEFSEFKLTAPVLQHVQLSETNVLTDRRKG